MGLHDRPTETFKMATVAEALSYLRTLTSNSPNTPPAEKKKDFDELLIFNMQRLRENLCEKGTFPEIERRLQIQTLAHVRELEKSDHTFDGNKDAVEKLHADKESREKEFKDCIRWIFVEACIELVKLLKEALIGVAIDRQASGKEDNQNSRKRDNEVPQLPPDTLGVTDQKTVLTAIQFVVILGICPNLLSGVGVPVEKRSGFASLLNIRCYINNERRLFECINTLVDCIEQPSLGALILSRHLGDVLAGLLQLCYAPVSAYSNNNKGSTASTERKSDISDSNTSKIVHGESCGDPNSTTENPHSTIKTESSAEPSVRSTSSNKLDPGALYALEKNPPNRKEKNDEQLFITSSEREKCSQDLQRILDRVYQPMVVRDLLMLQGGLSNGGKQPGKVSSREASGHQRVNHGGTLRQTPRWMRNICGQLLSERLMKQNGVKAVLHALLERSAGGAGSPDWKKCDVIAKLIANCPSQAESVEEYYKLVSPQIIQLLHGQSAGVGRLYIRTASSVIMEMLIQYPELAQKYVLSPIIRPLAQTTERQGGRARTTVVDENKVEQCVEDIHKVFVSGSPKSAIKVLLPIVHPVFELFCFTRKGVSHLRSALQEILVHVLKQVEPCQVLHLLYTLAFKMNPSDNLSLSKSSAHSNGARKDEKEVIVIPLMDENFVFAYGDEGGALIRYQSADEQFNAESILRDLQGNDLSGSEVQAQCIVELLRGLNKDAIAGDFFIYLTQELTKIISDFSEEIEYKDVQHNLLILHLVALMCEKLGPSILTDTPQMLAFIESTLIRACAIIHADEQGLGLAFVTETLTMALGMLLAALSGEGGGLEMKKEHRPLVQNLLPLLETLAEQHSSVEVRDMASDLRIAIATHGAVWSHKMEAAAMNFGKQTDAVRINSESTAVKENANAEEKDKFDEAFSQVCDPLIPVRGHGLLQLASLLRQRNPKAVQATDTLLKIFLEQLSHDDSYIYLAAIQGLVSLADVRADTVMPQLAREFVACRKDVGITAGSTKEANDKGYYKPVSCGANRSTRSPELRMKIGEALVKATRICGELVPKYSQHLLPALLTGVKDPEPLVRASSLSNLGEVCQLLRFSLGPVVNEIFSCVSAVLKTDKSAEVRRATVLVLTLLLRGLGKSIMEVLSSTLREIYQLLKVVESTDPDDMTRLHAQTALDELNNITREYLFPEPSFTKHIQVLP